MSQVPSRYSAKAISGNVIKNDSSTLLNAGNVNSALANNLTLAENAGNQNLYGSQITVSVSPTSSGNVGIGKAISNGTVNVNQEGNYIAQLLGTKIAGITTTQLRNSAGARPRTSIKYFEGYRRLDETGWNAVTGAVTKGANAGVLVEASGINGQLGHAADHSLSHPGEFSSMQGGPNPVQDDYIG